MLGKSLSPTVFRRRSGSQLGSVAVDQIVFPKSYEDEWDLADIGSSSTEFDKARFFMVRFANMASDQILGSEVLEIARNQDNRTVLDLASAVRTSIFANRHATFAATPLLQCMRFILIKTLVTEGMFSDRTKPVIDFFFDPTIARNLDPLPKHTVTYRYPAAPLKVCIVGGGPTGLSSAISLAEKGAGKIEVDIYEKRWIARTSPNGTRIEYPPGAKRRDQVVTLQDSVTSLMSKESQQVLFGDRPERVWPGSANIQIQKVENRLLQRCQADEFRNLIHLHTESVNRYDLFNVGDFHVLLGADGAASWLRSSYFEGYEKERGRSYALGLAFDRPAGLPWPQPLNIFLTLGQTRYLLNASNFDGRGYLNMQLTEDEWYKMVTVDDEPVTFGNPGCLRVDGKVPKGFKESQIFAPSEDRESRLWKAIEDGLKLFGFKESEVINVVRIPIVVQAVRQGVKQLPAVDARAINRPHALVAVAGDAAMTVHFWPGRGLNSGIKSGIALADEIAIALNSGQFLGLPLTAMKEYDAFIQKLQAREHDKRSIPILNQSGSPEMLGWLLGKAQSVPDKVAVEWLVGAMLQIADRLQGRADWPFEPMAKIEPQLRTILRYLTSMTLREMAVSFPWPTREMAGAEILPIRSMRPEEKNKWLQQLWTILRDEKSKGMPSNLRPSLGPRFEALPSTSPMHLEPTMQRSNATLSPSPTLFEQNPTVSTGNNTSEQLSSLCGDAPLARLLSVTKRPGGAMLTDAMSLALFRVDE
jgi:2-polyprenyl-6-methoxyphenol hydroxylase-like FAD-dependent oxidoreductase